MKKLLLRIWGTVLLVTAPLLFLVGLPLMSNPEYRWITIVLAAPLIITGAGVLGIIVVALFCFIWGIEGPRNRN